MAPAGTPPEIVTRLYGATAAALKKPDAAARFATLGTDVGLMDPAQLADFIKSEITKWSRMAKEAGIQPQ